MSKETKNKLKELKEEISDLKGKMFDLDKEIDKRFDFMMKQIQQISVVLDFHAHPSSQMSGRPMFLQEQYDTFLKEQQKQQQIPTPVPDEEDEEE